MEGVGLGASSPVVSGPVQVIREWHSPPPLALSDVDQDSVVENPDELAGTIRDDCNQTHIELYRMINGFHGVSASQGGGPVPFQGEFFRVFVLFGQVGALSLCGPECRCC